MREKKKNIFSRKRNYRSVQISKFTYFIDDFNYDLFGEAKVNRSSKY